MKYVITDIGRTEFVQNRLLHREPSVYNKLLAVLSSGIGYTPTSLLSFIQSDSVVSRHVNDFATALDQLSKDGYIKSVANTTSTPLILGGD